MKICILAIIIMAQIGVANATTIGGGGVLANCCTAIQKIDTDNSVCNGLVCNGRTFYDCGTCPSSMAPVGTLASKTVCDGNYTLDSGYVECVSRIRCDVGYFAYYYLSSSNSSGGLLVGGGSGSKGETGTTITTKVGKSMCLPCPEDGTSDAGAQDIKSCYKIIDTTGTDETGTWEEIGKCRYNPTGADFDTLYPDLSGLI